MLEAITEQNQDARIYIRADRIISYGRVMEVMSTINTAGYKKVALVTQNPEKDWYLKNNWMIEYFENFKIKNKIKALHFIKIKIDKSIGGALVDKDTDKIGFFFSSFSHILLFLHLK